MPEENVDCVLVTIRGPKPFTEEHYRCLEERVYKKKYPRKYKYHIIEKFGTDKAHSHSQDWFDVPIRASNLCRSIKKCLEKHFPEDYPEDNAFKSYVQCKKAYSFMKEYFTKDGDSTKVVAKELPEQNWIDGFFKGPTRERKNTKPRKFLQKLRDLWNDEKGPEDSTSQSAVRDFLETLYQREVVDYPRDFRAGCFTARKLFCLLNKEKFVSDSVWDRFDMNCM